MSPGRIRDAVAELAERSGLQGVPARSVVAGAAVVLVILGMVAWRWMPRSRGGEIASGGLVEAVATSGSPSAVTSRDVSATIFVHVGGSVRHPGVYELGQGSRVVQAVEAAGGLLPDAVSDGINLARLAVDGEQILVPSEDDAEKPAVGVAGTSTSVGGGASAGGPVDINSADVSLLDTLPGVGPSTAAKIVAEREANGRFTGVDDLARVSGIGPKKLDALRDLVCAR